MSEAILTFAGMNTIKGATKLSASELALAQDVDLDREGRVSCRAGYRKLLTGAVHSVWSDGVRCYFADGATLYQLNADFTVRQLAVLSCDDRLDYVDVNGLVVCSNGADIGAIDTDGYRAFDPNQSMRSIPVVPTPPGQLLAFYKGALLVAANDQLVETLPYTLEAVDDRNGFTPMGSRITMLKAVDDGVWLSTSDAVWFRAGAYDEISMVKKMDVGAVEGSAVTSVLGYSDLPGAVVWFMTEHGVCVGGNGGLLRMVSKGVVAVKRGVRGAGLFREQQGQTHYLSVINGAADARNAYTPAQAEFS